MLKGPDADKALAEWVPFLNWVALLREDFSSSMLPADIRRTADRIRDEIIADIQSVIRA